jgi:hypothetical protein
VAEPAAGSAGSGVSGGLHRLHQREDPRWAGREPADLCRAGGHRRRDAGHPWAVGCGLWAGEHGDGEGAKYWLRVLSEIKNRGTQDVCIVVCDGLKGLPDAVGAVWPQTIVQTCIVHLLRNSFR